MMEVYMIFYCLITHELHQLNRIIQKSCRLLVLLQKKLGGYMENLVGVYMSSEENTDKTSQQKADKKGNSQGQAAHNAKKQGTQKKSSTNAYQGWDTD